MNNVKYYSMDYFINDSSPIKDMKIVQGKSPIDAVRRVFPGSKVTRLIGETEKYADVIVEEVFMYDGIPQRMENKKRNCYKLPRAKKAEISKTLSKVFADVQKNPITGRYEKVGNKRLTVMRSVVNDDVLIFDYNGSVKSVLVKDSDEYVYQIRKRYINAIDGADGLFNFLEREITSGFYPIIFDKVFNYMKKI